MYKGQTITVIIPCLNEEQGIERVLSRMPEFVDETIVVDNGSTDRTSDVARSMGAKVVREDVRGYGRAYKTGFSQDRQVVRNVCKFRIWKVHRNILSANRN